MIEDIRVTHGPGKTTTSALVGQLIPDPRVFDAEKVGETLMDITPRLPWTGNFQDRPPRRPTRGCTPRPRSSTPRTSHPSGIRAAQQIAEAVKS